MTEENQFTRQRTQGEVETHTGKQTHSELTTRSFSLYHSDITNIEEMGKHLNQFSRKKINNSLVVRVALNHLKKSLEQGGIRFEKEVEQTIKDSI